MTIETKYNRYEMVWYLDGNVAKCDQVTAIYINVEDGNSDEVWVRYRLRNSNYSEHEVHLTKEELLKSL